MTLFDYVVLGIIAASLLLGFWRGVVGEMLSLAAWVLAFFAARMFGPELGEALFTGKIVEPGWRLVAGYAVAFIGVLLVVALVKLAVRGLLKALGLGLTDRMLGVLFGILRGVLVCVVLVALGGMTSAPRQGWWMAATLSPPLETAVLILRPWLPDDLAKRIHFR